MKFYADDKDGGLNCVAVRIWDGRYARPGKLKTRAWVKARMAREGFFARKTLPPGLRGRIPQGGMSPNREVVW